MRRPSDLSKGFVLPVLAIALSGITGQASAQTKDNVPASSPLPASWTPDAMRVELSNGMVLFLVEDHELPVVNIVARLTAGSLWESVEKPGVATVTAEVLRAGGTTDLPADQLERMLDNYSASLSVSISESVAHASLSAPQETIDAALRLFADVLMHPAFSDDRVESAKLNARTMIGARTDASHGKASSMLDGLLYGIGSPYVRTPDATKIESITRDDLVAFHEAFFHPNNVIVGVWGDFDTVAMVKMIDRAFEGWLPDPTFSAPPPPEYGTGAAAGIYVTHEPDSARQTILFGQSVALTQSSPDYPATLLLNEVLSGRRGRLERHVRGQEDLADSVFGNLSAHFDRPGFLYTGVLTGSESIVEATKSVLHEMERLRDEEPSTTEIEIARTDWLKSTADPETPSAIITRLMTYEAYGYPSDFRQRVIRGVKRVSPQDVMVAARSYLHPDSLVVLVVGGEPGIGSRLEAIGPVRYLESNRSAPVSDDD